jgi:two-component system LytT family response regulator
MHFSISRFLKKTSRIHHSNIINKYQVEKYIRGEGGQVVLRNGVVLDVSKRKKSEFLQAIGY